MNETQKKRVVGVALQPETHKILAQIAAQSDLSEEDVVRMCVARALPAVRKTLETLKAAA